MVGHVLEVELPVQEHLDDGGVAARRLHVLPGAVAAQQFRVQLVESETPVQPVLVPGDGVIVVGRVRLGRGPGGGIADPVPGAPDPHRLVAPVSRHQLAQVALDVHPPHRVVEVVGHAAVWGKVPGHVLLHAAVPPDGAHVGVLAQHPGRSGHVGSKRGVEPHLEPVFRRGVEQQVEVVELVAVWQGLDPVPAVPDAHDAHAGGADAAEIAVPELRGRRRRPVVLGADGKRFVEYRPAVLVPAAQLHPGVFRGHSVNPA